MTNYEKIKNMVLDEMQKVFASFGSCRTCPCAISICRNHDNCGDSFREWLESEAKE